MKSQPILGTITDGSDDARDVCIGARISHHLSTVFHRCSRSDKTSRRGSAAMIHPDQDFPIEFVRRIDQFHPLEYFYEIRAGISVARNGSGASYGL
jgi:hypothetical protein